MKTTQPIIAVPRSKSGILILQTFLEIARAHRDPRQQDLVTAQEAMEFEKEFTARLEEAKKAFKEPAALPS